MSQNTKFLDLDAVAPKLTLTVKLNGKNHVMKTPTVEDFVENMKLIESLKAAAGPAVEMDYLVQLLTKAFPTMTEKDLKGLHLEQLKQLADYAQQHSGQTDIAEEAAEKASANPPQAPAP